MSVALVLSSFAILTAAVGLQDYNPHRFNAHGAISWGPWTMTTPSSKRRRTGDRSTDALPTARLAADDVDTLTATVNLRRNTLLSWFGNEKLPKRKVALKNAIIEMCDAFNSLVSVYLFLLTANDAADVFSNAMNRVCVKLTQANSAPSNSTPAPRHAARASYASVAANSAAFPAPSNEPSKIITLSRGNVFPIRSSEVVIIGPSSDAEAKFISSNATKEALLKAVDSVALKLKVQGIRAGPNHGIVVESDTANCATLSKCAELAKCGLEVKPCAKLLPRVIIHDIPVKNVGR